MPIVSVLLPCYNAEHTLVEALSSIFGQTLQDFEIIAVDDGSTDQTGEILQHYALRDNRLRVISIRHGGIIDALNAGLEHCSSPYLARMDSDDRSHQERLARQVDYLERQPGVGLVSCRAAIFPAEIARQGFQLYIDWQNSLLDHEHIKREIFIESPFPHPSVTLRRELLESAGGYQEHGWAEDYDLWLRMYLAGVKFAKLPEVLLDWREGPTRLTRTDSRYSLENFIRTKAHYLALGPLSGREAVFVWGAGMTGRRLSKHLVRNNVELAAFIDVDTKKIGGTKRGLPVISAEQLPEMWKAYKNPALLSAVGARRARPLIRERLASLNLVEGIDWWCAA